MKIYSWGSNSHGQLGQGTNVEQIIFPVPINLDVVPKSVCGGGKHTVLLTVDNKLFLCGDNDKGQVGQKLKTPLVNTFHHLSLNLKISKVVCGWDFNLALTEEHEVFAWGSNSFGQLGLSTEKIKYSNTPQKVFENKVLTVGAGLRHSAIVTLDGLVFTTGYGRKGQLGVFVNETTPSVLDKFTLVKGISNCKWISCGEHHCIAITKNGELYSWGNNKYGQLGLDPNITSFSSTPIQITIPENIKCSELVSGWAHNFILSEKGKLITWGRNDFGQLGEKRLVNWQPDDVKNLARIKQVSLGSHHCIVLTENGEVLTWGWNEHGNCGNESCDNNILEPFKLKQFSGVKLIGSGAAHSFLWN